MSDDAVRGGQRDCSQRVGGERFWEVKKPEELSPEEWEALCDGCAKCCICKVENLETGDFSYSDICCRLLDPATARCRSYARRKELIPDCGLLTPEKVRKFRWLPATCAYRLVIERKELYYWHHLISGDPEMIHRLGLSVRNRVVSESEVPAELWGDHVITERY